MDNLYQGRATAPIGQYVAIAIIGAIILGAGFFIITRINKPAAEPTFARCEQMVLGTYGMLQAGAGVGTMVGFDSLKKPCVYNNQKEAWEPLVYNAQPAATPAR